jgi:hypothetical protein
MRFLPTKTGTTDDAAPSGAPSSIARAFNIQQTFGLTIPSRAASLRGYFQALDGGAVRVAGVTCLAQLYFCDPATNVWYTVGPAQTLTAESHFAFPFVPLDANTSAYLQLTTFANVGTTATVVVHAIEGGEIADTVSPPVLQYVAAGKTLTDGQMVPAQATISGFEKVSLGDEIAGENRTDGVIAAALKFVASGTYSPSLYTNWGASTSANVKASPGIVNSFYATNGNGAVRYIQFHNLTTAPGGGTTPIYSFPVAPGGTLSLGADFWTQNGAKLSTGLGIAVTWSTTQGTYTAATAADHTLHVHYN